MHPQMISLSMMSFEDGPLMQDELPEAGYDVGVICEPNLPIEFDLMLSFIREPEPITLRLSHSRELVRRAG